MKCMVNIYPEDYCMDCNSEHSLMIYDIFNRPTSMLNIINDPSILSKKEFVFIKCKNCGKEYNIDWSSDTRVPRPLLSNIHLNQFLHDFKQNNKYILYK